MERHGAGMVFGFNPLPALRPGDTNGKTKSHAREDVSIHSRL